MRILVIYAHPVEESFNSAIHRRILDILTRRGHDVIDTDLYRENFQPVLTRDERNRYFMSGENTDTVQEYVDNLRWAEALVFCFPTWWHGMPAILKGYLDRVWLPGVAFHLTGNGGPLQPGLQHIQKLALVTTYGAPWWFVQLIMRHPIKTMLLRGLKPLLGKGAQVIYLAHHDLDRTSEKHRNMFLQKVQKSFEKF
ncbi:MAG: NAD(P)H-dependent oxidoreductase [Gammaproteobacteria bacterium]|nr:NAD(P)H-dependent oxidoreductase [Gammaproteobacteria bacterium]MCI0590258.1 NAD(P)H-dependent oxidoreductase [Gammaproteobacteria bacterium]